MGARAWLVSWMLAAAASAHAAPEVTVRPAPPAIATGSRVFVAFAGRPAPVRFAWPPVTGAARYRATWSTVDASVDVELPGTATSFERAESRSGSHRLSIVAIDASGGESPPAEVAIDVVKITAFAPGTDTPTPADDGAFAIGARFSSRGLRCQLGDGRPAAEVIAAEPGAFQLRCAGDEGAPRVEVPVVIAPVVVVADAAPLWRLTPTRIHVSVASVAPVGDLLVVEAFGDLDVDNVERTPDGLDVTVTGGTGCESAGLIVSVGEIELGRVGLELVERPPPPPPPTSRSAWFALDLGAQVGALVTPQYGRGANLLGRPTDPGDTIGSGPFAGVRLGLFPTRRVGLELETALATPGYTERPGFSAMMLNRIQLATRIVEDGRFGLRGLVGGDVLSVLVKRGTSRPGSLGGVHYGGAFTVETRSRVSVRFQALHVITVAQNGGFAHCLEIQVGVVTRLGRLDRWN